MLDDHDIESLALAVLDASLPKAEWTHAAHFAFALHLLRHRPGLAAPDRIGALIRSYNDATETPNTDTAGYHETITLASMRGAAHWLAQLPDALLGDVLAALLASPLGRPDWLAAHWSEGLLMSREARRSWCDPDRAALPFT